MTQLDLLYRARNGDPEAIATLLNRSLQSQGITANANCTANGLQIMLDALDIPDQKKTVTLIHQRLQRLELLGIDAVHLYARQQGNPIPAWNQTVSLQRSATPAQSSSRSAPSQSNLSTSPRSRVRKLRCPRPFITFASAMMLLFAPIGLFAFIFATQVENRYRRNDYQGAKAASQLAYTLCWISLGVAGVIYMAIAAVVGTALFAQLYRVNGSFDTSGRSSEAQMSMSAIIRAQILHYQDYRWFVKTVDSLDVGIRTNNGYTYSISEQADDRVITVATPYRSGLSTYQGAIFVTGDRDDPVLIYGICQDTTPSARRTGTSRSVSMPPKLVGTRIDCGETAVLQGEGTHSFSP